VARVLLAGFDKDMANELALLFARLGHQIVILPATAAPYELSGSGEVDMIVLEVSIETGLVKSVLAAKAESDQPVPGPPILLCVSRVYRGPRFELDLERRGGRLVYVH